MKREDTTRVWRTLFEVTDWMRNINAGLIDQTFLNLTFNQLRMIKIVYELLKDKLNIAKITFPSGVNAATQEYTPVGTIDRCPLCGVALVNGVCPKCGYRKH